jgi:hypothetical protein
MDFTRIGLIFSGHGFGFNTNILETNVINLAVVIAVVVGRWRRSARIIKNRKETIINNLREADNQQRSSRKTRFKSATTRSSKASKKIKNRNSCC